jgi:hypothetical protein
MKRDKIPLSCLSELYDQLVSMFEQAPDHGKITLAVHLRDGCPQRYETTREASVIFNGGKV